MTLSFLTGRLLDLRDWLAYIGNDLREGVDALLWVDVEGGVARHQTLDDSVRDAFIEEKFSNHFVHTLPNQLSVQTTFIAFC